MQWTKSIPSSSTFGVNIPPQGRVVVAAYGDGTIRWHRLSDGQELLAFFPHADRKRWVLWTPSGYFDASVGGEDLIGWHVNRGADAAADFFPASQFRSQFHRPDVIDRVLDTLDEAEALKQADAARGSRPSQIASPTAAAAAVLQSLPPVVEVVSGTELRTTQPTVTIRVRARTSADARVTQWQVRVNGLAVPDARGLGRQGDDGMRTDERELVVPVPARDSEIQVFATNRHATSTPAVLRVQWAGTKSDANASVQRKLVVLAVGVSRYPHPDIPKLNLAAKDAKDFASAMQGQKGRHYTAVDMKILVEEEATRDNIMDGLDWLQKTVGPNDIGMLFIGGHGLDDPSLGYTFLPWNADPDKLKRTGVTTADISTTLRQLRGRGAAFLDTCHAGSVVGGQGRRSDITRAINELGSAENGVVVFSSSTGRQVSYEDPSWGNGAFTKAVVEGMQGKADLLGDGQVTHNSLALWVSKRVSSLTNNRQTPVKHDPGNVPDFALAVVK